MTTRGESDYIIGQYHDETPAFEARGAAGAAGQLRRRDRTVEPGSPHAEVEVAPGNGRGRDQTVGAIFIDIDGFRLVNDSLGHDAGDRLLRLFGERLLCLPEVRSSGV